MNRGEQENLFHQSHTFRVQQDGLNKAHKLHLQNQRRKRGFSQGNIHQLSILHPHSVNTRSFGEERLAISGGRACDDLVLSVLKTPVRDAAASAMLQLATINSQSASRILPVTTANANNPINTHTTTTFIPAAQQQLTILSGTPKSSVQSPSKYQALQAGGSEDELVDDVESAKETTKLSGFSHSDEDDMDGDVHRKSSAGGSSKGGGFKFLRRFRTSRSPSRRRSRGRSHADILDGVAPPPTSHGNNINNKE